MRRQTRSIAWCASLAVVLAAPAPARSQDCPGADTPPSGDTLQTVRDATACLVNHERARAGVPALATSPALGGTSGDYAGDMVARRYFGHTPPEGTSLAQRLRPWWDGAEEWRGGEDLYWSADSASGATARATVHAWMNSASHRENVLAADFREIGVGVALGTPHGHGSGATYAAHFGVIHSRWAEASWRSADAAPRRTSKRRRCKRGHRLKTVRPGVRRCRKAKRRR